MTTFRNVPEVGRNELIDFRDLDLTPRAMPTGKILVVEDDAVLQQVASAVLTAEGYDVQVASDVCTARVSMEICPPDLVLMDRSLPDGDGLALTEEVKGDPRRSGFVILAFSARCTATDDLLALGSGADGFVPKPFEPELLLRTVAWHLATRERRNSGPFQMPAGIDRGSRRWDGTRSINTISGEVARFTAAPASGRETLSTNSEHIIT